ncbi:cytoplasmic alanine-tRNA ligase Ala1-like protein, partial [Leptotrombidium deliense]
TIRNNCRFKSGFTANEVRRTFIEYFRDVHNHTFVKSSSVLPENDKSLTLVNAGMNQFKPIFLGTLNANDPLLKLKRATNTQKCIRLGGKHCDLHNVGINYRHHTFFEMLGNWSFGDYFKDEAIKMAFYLVRDVYKLDLSRIFVTYFGGCSEFNLKADHETFEIWKSLGFSANRIIGLGMKDNFWEMGDVGPCGGCTEIHYLLNPVPDDANTETLLNNSIEIWNLVFMQYEKTGKGELKNLPAFHVDTGMGLERMTSVLQGVNSNYDTDLFTPLFDKIKQVTGAKAYGGSLSDPLDTAYRILADHARMFTVAISDGVVCGHIEGGYSLRQVIRRAASTAKKFFGQQNPADLLTLLTETVAHTLEEPFPEIRENLYDIKGGVNNEVKKFNKTFKKAAMLFEQKLDTKTRFFSGEEALRLHFYHGIDEESLKELASKFNAEINWTEFNEFYAVYEKKKKFSRKMNAENVISEKLKQ